MPTLFNIVDSHESLSVRRFKWQNYGDKVEEGLRQTPSAQSTLLFNTMREDLDEDTRDVDDAIASLRAKLEFLERGKRRIEQLQSRVSAVLAPIRRLSDEILLRIFLHSIDGTPLNVEYLSGAYMNFSFVHPTWARVFDDLSRSLFVSSLEIHDVSCNDVISFAMEQCARRLLHVDFKGDVASWQHLLSFPDRLSSLQIAVTRQQWDMLLPIAGSLQRVHSITLDAQQDSSAEPWCDVLSHIPNLTSVSFIGSSQQGLLTSVPLGRLTHFSDTRPYADVSPDLYLDILEKTPSLVSVDLRSKESAATANPIQRNLVMPNLRRLTIGDRTLLPSFVSLPVLEHLELALPWFFSTDASGYVASPFRLAHELVQRWGAVATLTSLSFGKRHVSLEAEDFEEDFYFLQQLVSTLCRRLLHLELGLTTMEGAVQIDEWLCRLNTTIIDWCASGERKSISIEFCDNSRDIYPERLSFASKGLVSLVLSRRLHLEITICRWVRGGEASIILSAADRKALREKKELGENNFIIQYYNSTSDKTIDCLNPPPPPSPGFNARYAPLFRTYSTNSSALPASEDPKLNNATLRRSDSLSTASDGGNVSDDKVPYDDVDLYEVW